jgi:tetratricopeptide (TPR) repeat protein
MSRTLHLVHQLFAQGQRLYRLGALTEAHRVFARLAAWRQLPRRLLRRLQEYLAVIYLRRRCFRQARRYLAALLAAAPRQARYHYCMARAVAADPQAGRQRALFHCRRAVALAPGKASYLSTLGLLTLRQGQQQHGLDLLRQAALLEPNDPHILRRLVKGLCLTQRHAEARRLLRTALFRHSSDGRFLALWQQFQWDDLYQRQLWERRRQAERNGGPVLLPFLRLQTPAAPTPCATQPTLLPGPHQLPATRRLNQRRAQ